MEAGYRIRLRGWKIVFLGGLFYLAFLAASIPASVIARQIERQAGERVLFSSEQGTLWSGTADMLIADANGGAIPQRVGAVSWRFRAADLWLGQLGFNLELADTDVMAKGTLRQGMSGLRLRDVKAEIPVGWLTGFHSALATWRPTGKLLVEASDFDFASNAITGHAIVRWLNASSALAARPFGSYRLNLEGKSQGIAIALSTEQGVLELSGAGNWNRQAGLTFDGIARKNAGAEGLDEFLRAAMGTTQGDGSHVIRIRE